MKLLRMKMYSAISTILLGSILAVGDVTTESVTFKSLKRVERLPAWLSYITKEKRPDHRISDIVAIEQMQNYKGKNRLPEMEHKFQNAFKNADRAYIPDSIAAFVNDWAASTDCQKNAFSVDAFMSTVSTITASEEKVMIFTLIRIIASYLFDSKDKLKLSLNKTHAAIEIKFEIPDLELIPAYYVMLDVNKNSEGFRCKTKK